MADDERQSSQLRLRSSSTVTINLESGEHPKHTLSFPQAQLQVQTPARVDNTRRRSEPESICTVVVVVVIAVAIVFVVVALVQRSAPARTEVRDGPPPVMALSDAAVTVESSELQNGNRTAEVLRLRMARTDKELFPADIHRAPSKSVDLVLRVSDGGYQVSLATIKQLLASTALDELRIVKVYIRRGEDRLTTLCPASNYDHVEC